MLNINYKKTHIELIRMTRLLMYDSAFLPWIRLCVLSRITNDTSCIFINIWYCACKYPNIIIFNPL